MFTQLPNDFVDEHMRNLDSAAVLVYLVICRQTIGWQRDSDSISLTQFQQVTGLSRPTILKARAQLYSAGLIRWEDHAVNGVKQSNTYTIIGSKQFLLRSKQDLPSSASQDPDSKPDLLRSKQDLPTHGKQDLPPVVNGIDIQKKGSNKQERNNSAPRQRDERIDLWQLTVYRELCRLHVPHALRDMVISSVSDEQRWRSVILAWIARGYRPNAISGMLDWYEKGIPDGRRSLRQNDGRDPAPLLSPEDYVRAADAV